MHKIQILVFSMVMGFSGVAYAAERELTKEQQLLKENLLAAVYVSVLVENGIKTTPLISKRELRQSLYSYTGKVENLIEQGVTLSEGELAEIDNLREKFKQECEYLKSE